jgi:hypothetical protein
MKAFVVTLPKSGTRLLTSLLNSHPDLTCRFGDEAADVGVFHFHNVRWTWAHSIPMILLTRDYFEGAISELVSPQGGRVDEQFRLTPASVDRVHQRRELYTELLRPHASYVMSYEDLTDNGQEILTRELPEICEMLGVRTALLTSAVSRLPRAVPANIEELRGTRS